MRVGASFDQIFPMRDAASAQLMRLKADCLFRAGTINATERCEVYLRSVALLELSAQALPAEASLVPAWMQTETAREPKLPERIASAV